MTRLVATALFVLAGPAAAADVVLNPGRHPGPGFVAAISADGKTVVTLGSDRCARAWAADTGTPLAELWLPEAAGRHTGGAYLGSPLWLSPDGKTLAVPFHAPDEPRGRLALVPLAAPDRGTYRVVGGHDFDVTDAVFSPDGKRVAVASGGHPVLVLDVGTGKPVCEIKYDRDMRAAGMAFTPDGTKLTVALPMANFNGGKRSGVSTFDAATGKLISDLPRPDGKVEQVSMPRWSPDGKLLALNRMTVEVVAADGTPRQRIGGITPARFLDHVAFDAAGRLLAAWRTDDAYTVRDELAGKEVARLTRSGNVVGFSADGRRALTAGDVAFTVHDLATGKAVRRVEAASPAVNAVGWAGGRVLAWGTGPSAYRKDAPVAAALDLAKLEPAKLDPKAVTRRRLEWGGVTLTDDGYRAKATANGKAVPLEYEPELDCQDVKATTLVGPGHAVLVTGGGYGGYDTKTGKQVCRYPHAGWALAPSADGRVFAVNDFYDPLVRVYRPGTEEPALTLYVAGSEWVAWTAGGFWAASPGGAGLAGALSKEEPGKLRTFVPFPAEKRDPDTVRAAVR
jgi:WD40 repeat protein